MKLNLTISRSFGVTVLILGCLLCGQAQAQYQISAVSGTPQAAALQAPFASCLTVQVTYNNGSPAAGVVVTFTAPATMVTLSSTTATTAAGGTALVCATASAVQGNYIVTASVAGGASTPFYLANAGPGTWSLGPVALGSSNSVTLGYYLPVPQGAQFGLLYGVDFSVPTSTCVPSAAYYTVTVIFKPKYPGMRGDVLTITDGHGKLLLTVTLTGQGLGPALAFTPGVISTVAGNGIQGYNNDSIAATSAKLNIPSGVAVDGAGNLYIADTWNNRVRKVDVNGTITTVAGNGTTSPWYATLYYPTGVAVDLAGNVYIADSYNHLVKEVDAYTGVMTWVAGLYNCCNSYGMPIPGYSGDGGKAASAQLSRLGGLALDGAGNLYIADFDNSLIRKVNASTGIITTVAGNYRCCDSYGNPQGGHSGDGGPATSAQLNEPSGVAVDALGNLYIADYGNNVIRKVDTNGIITTCVENLKAPTGVAVDSAGSLYIADYGNNVIRKVDANTLSLQLPGSAVPTTVAGTGFAGYSGDGGVATGGALSGPNGVALDAAGNLYIADQGNQRIRKVDVTTSALSFDVLAVGLTSSPQNVTVSNVGTAGLDFSSLQVQPASPQNFQLQTVGSDCAAGILLPSGASCQVGAAFTPTLQGNPLTATLQVTDDAFNSPQSVQLSGQTAQPQTSLSVTAQPAFYGAIVTLSATLTPPFSGEPISFSIGAPTLGGTAIGVVGTINTVNGVATWSGTLPASASPGTYPITATFAGDTNYTLSSATGDLTISPAATTLSVNVVNWGTYGETMTLSATLTSGGSGVPGKSISVAITCTGASPSDTASALTNASGVATIQVPVGGLSLPANGIPPGSYDSCVAASFAGDSNYTAAVAPSIGVLVYKAPTSLSVSAVSGAYGGTVDLYATLTHTHTGAAISGETVYFGYGSAPNQFTSPLSIGTAITDANGQAHWRGTLPLSIAAGVHTCASGYALAAMFNYYGNLDPNYISSFGCGDVTVTQATSSSIGGVLDVTGIYASAYSSGALIHVAVGAALTATVTSPAGAVNEGTVTFTFQNAAVGSYSAPVMGGQARVGGVVVPSPGTYTFQAAYSGSANFPPSSESSTHSLTVRQSVADLAVTYFGIPADQQPADPEEVTVVVQVANLGPEVAWTPTLGGGQLYADNGMRVGSISPFDVITTHTTIRVQWLDGTITETVGSDAIDPNPANNSASLTVNGIYYTAGAIDRPARAFQVGADGYGFGNNPGNADWSLYEDTFGSDNVDPGLTSLTGLVNLATLDTAAAAYYELIYKRAFGNGQCYGMSATSLRFFQLKDSLASFGWGGFVHGVTTDYSQTDRIWRNIEKYQGYQVGNQFIHYYLEHCCGVVHAVSDFKAAMSSSSSSGNGNPGILLLISGRDGHAVVPYRLVEATDSTGHWADIYVYDNDDPNSITQVVHVDIGRDTYYYNSDYSSGFANGLMYVPSSLNDSQPGLPFNDPTGIFVGAVSGSASMLTTDTNGNALGYQNGTLVENVPGAKPIPATGDSATAPEMYAMPPGQYVTTLSGKPTASGPATASLFKYNSLLTFTSANMTPTTQDTISVSQDGSSVVLSTNAANENYGAILYTVLGPATTRNFAVSNTAMASGEKITMAFLNGGDSFQISNQGAVKSYDVKLTQTGTGDPVRAAFTGLSIGANETHTFAPSDWTNLNSAPVNLQIQNSHGTTSGTLQAPVITSPNSASFTYGIGGTFTVTTTGFPPPLLSETGTLPSGVVWNPSTGVLNVATSAVPGVYAISLTAVNTLGTSAAQGFTLTVNPAPLTIAAVNKTKVYGAPLPALTAIYSGLVNGDTSSVLGGALSCITTATAMSNVGAYPITCSGHTSTDYTVTYVPAQLSITQDPSSTVVTSSATPSTLGQSVTFTATVSAAPPGSGTPTGVVTFKDGTTTLGTGNLTSGQATFGTLKLSVGSHSITAQYSGDTNFIAGSGTLAQQVEYKICALYDQTKAVQSGSTVPIKLYLCDTNGNDVSSPSIVLHATQVVNVSSVAGTPESPGNANPDNDFVFDSTLGTAGGYHFNLKTTGLATGTYSLSFTVTNDPVTHSVNFGVK